MKGREGRELLRDRFTYVLENWKLVAKKSKGSEEIDNLAVGGTCISYLLSLQLSFFPSVSPHFARITDHVRRMIGECRLHTRKIVPPSTAGRRPAERRSRQIDCRLPITYPPVIILQSQRLSIRPTISIVGDLLPGLCHLRP